MLGGGYMMVVVAVMDMILIQQSSSVRDGVSWMDHTRCVVCFYHFLSPPKVN